MIQPQFLRRRCPSGPLWGSADSRPSSRLASSSVGCESITCEACPRGSCPLRRSPRLRQSAIFELSALAGSNGAKWLGPRHQPKNAHSGCASGWQATPIDQFIQIVNSYVHLYNEKRIKISLGSCSPLESRESLGLAA